MAKFRFAVLDCDAREYAKVINLGNRCVGALTGNGNYPTPAPTLVAVQAALDDCTSAYSTWSSGEGSKADLADLREKSEILFGLLKALCEYVNNTAILLAGQDFSTLTTVLETSGFNLNKLKAPIGLLEQVKNFHVMVDASLNRNQGKLKWARPNGVRKGDVKSYALYKSATPNFADAVYVATLTRTDYIVTNVSAAAVTEFYFVAAVNTNGQGAMSEE